MFCVKEYYPDGAYIGHTFHECNKKAIELAKNILENKPDFICIVTEIDYNTEGYIWEVQVWPIFAIPPIVKA